MALWARPRLTIPWVGGVWGGGGRGQGYAKGLTHETVHILQQRHIAPEDPDVSVAPYGRIGLAQEHDFTRIARQAGIDAV